MMKKYATILMLVGVCLAFEQTKNEDEQRPPPPAIAELSEPGQELQPQLEILPEQAQPGLEQAQPSQEQGPVETQNPNDLKTDATFWWGRSHPFAYRRSYSYYRPRYYSYYTPYYAPYYSYWNSYW